MFMQIEVEACGADVTAETCAAGVLTTFTPNSWGKHACAGLQNGCDAENPTHNRCIFNEFTYSAEEQADLADMLYNVGDPRTCGTEPGTYAAAIISFGDGSNDPAWYTPIDACADRQNQRNQRRLSKRKTKTKRTRTMPRLSLPALLPSLPPSLSCEISITETKTFPYNHAFYNFHLYFNSMFICFLV